MKKIILIISMCLILFITSINASLPLSGKLIIIDVGHGAKDMGASYNNILEKNINLLISKKIETELVKNGASVVLTREDDYDLSSPNTRVRKRSDFNNRISFINNYKADLYLSVHINYLNDKTYSGAQVFYDKNNKHLAEIIQKHLNTISYPRRIKKMPDVYMYEKLKVNGVLIECGFISNNNEREKLINSDYQELLAKTITSSLIEYYQ